MDACGRTFVMSKLTCNCRSHDTHFLHLLITEFLKIPFLAKENRCYEGQLTRFGLQFNKSFLPYVEFSFNIVIIYVLAPIEPP